MKWRQLLGPQSADSFEQRHNPILLNFIVIFVLFKFFLNFFRNQILMILLWIF